MAEGINIYCFAHIPKAGGSTFIHLLRRNFGIRHVDAIHRMPTSSVERTYQVRDLQVDCALMPWALSFAGHWLKPWALSLGGEEKCRWTTIFRDPSARSLSQYWQDLQLGRVPGETTFANWAGMKYF